MINLSLASPYCLAHLERENPRFWIASRACRRLTPAALPLRTAFILISPKKLTCLQQHRHVAYVFQSLALFPHLTVEENIAYGLFACGPAERQERTDRAMQAFHIAQFRQRKPRELSGGEKQRVALARSLATDPHVLLLDEPLSGLDAGLRSAILQDLREWNEARQIPILYVTHNREEVDAIGERVVTLDQGRIISQGSSREVLEAPKSLAIAQVAGFENIFRRHCG